MANPHPVDSPTVHAHKRQFIWQILFPMVLVILLGLTAGGMVIAASVTGTGQTRLWADVSTIWILAPMLVVALAFIAVLGSIVYGFIRLLPIIPRFPPRAQQIASTISAGTRKVSDGVMKPFVWFQQAGAVIKSFVKKK